MSQLRSPDIRLFAFHETEAGLTVAQLEWPDAQPTDTYTIALNDFVSLELDRHTPVRPSGVTVDDAGTEQSAEMLATYMGQGFAEAMLKARRVGMLLTEFALDAENRFAMAGLQAASPSTPSLTRKLARNMIVEHDRALNSDRRTPLIPRARGFRLMPNVKHAPHTNF